MKVRRKPRRGAERVKRLARAIGVLHWQPDNGKRFLYPRRNGVQCILAGRTPTPPEKA